ncbi:MAG: hypothetical protein RR942_01340 [Romboutsia sp.]
MIIERELYLKVDKDLWGSSTRFWIDEDITILTKDDSVIDGILKEINVDNIIISKDNINFQIYFKNIEKIADTDWLGGCDIRED